MAEPSHEVTPRARKASGLRLWQVGMLVFLGGALLLGMFDSVRLACSREAGGVECAIERSLLGVTRSTVHATGVTNVALDVKVRRRKADHHRVELDAAEGRVRVLGDSSSRGDVKEWVESLQRFLADPSATSLDLSTTPWLGWIVLFGFTGLVIALPRIVRKR